MSSEHTHTEQSNIADDPYAEGNRRASNCPTCGAPIWVVYHGPTRNHTVEQRDEGKRS